MAIPSSLPISYSQITGEFGGTSLRTAAANAGLSVPISFSDFAGMSVNEGSGSFTAAFEFGVGVGYQIAVFGTGSCVFPNGKMVTAMYQGLAGNYTEIVVKADDNDNNDSVFKTIQIGDVTLNRTAALWNPNFGGTWTFSGIPLDTITMEVTYTPIFRTS